MEKRNYRDMLAILLEQNLPKIMDKTFVANYLGIAYNTLQKMIKRGLIKESKGKITIGSLANYLCD